MIELKVPPVGESISEVTLIKWTKADGTWVERDEVLCELESEKATFELNAEQAGILMQIAKEGDDLKIGDIACKIDTNATRPSVEPTANKAPVVTPTPTLDFNIPEAKATAPTSAPQPKTTPVASQIIADKQMDVNHVK